MPSTSEAQRRAMQAAAHGKSTLGIPKKVGQEFAAADSAKRSKSPFRLPMHKKKPAGDKAEEKGEPVLRGRRAAAEESGEM